jgi:hypothetical protein
MAIDAIQEIIQRIYATQNFPNMGELASIYSLHNIGEYLQTPELFSAAKEAWDWELMREHFLVRRSVDEMRRDLLYYLEEQKAGHAFRGDHIRRY